MSNKSNWLIEGLEYAKRNKIVSFVIVGYKLKYATTYPVEGSFKHIIDLKNNSETVIPLKHIIKSGIYNIG